MEAQSNSLLVQLRRAFGDQTAVDATVNDLLIAYFQHHDEEWLDFFVPTLATEVSVDSEDVSRYTKLDMILYALRSFNFGYLLESARALEARLSSCLQIHLQEEILQISHYSMYGGSFPCADLEEQMQTTTTRCLEQLEHFSRAGLQLNWEAVLKTAVLNLKAHGSDIDNAACCSLVQLIMRCLGLCENISQELVGVMDAAVAAIATVKWYVCVLKTNDRRITCKFSAQPLQNMLLDLFSQVTQLKQQSGAKSVESHEEAGGLLDLLANLESDSDIEDNALIMSVNDCASLSFSNDPASLDACRRTLIQTCPCLQDANATDLNLVMLQRR